MLLFFVLNLRHFSEIYKKRNNNPLLLKSTLKYLVYCPVFWFEVWRLQDQCISIWALVFHLTKYKLFYIKKVKVTKYLLLLFADFFLIFRFSFFLSIFFFLLSPCIFHISFSCLTYYRNSPERNCLKLSI